MQFDVCDMLICVIVFKPKPPRLPARRRGGSTPPKNSENSSSGTVPEWSKGRPPRVPKPESDRT